MENTIYDRIGEGYTRHRRADPRIVDAIVELLGLPPGSAIADVGAGTGSYSSALARRGYAVKAIEPSEVMRLQAEETERVEWLSCTAEAIPLPTGSIAAAIGIFSFHHFRDPAAGLAEMARVSRGGSVLLFTFDPREAGNFWLSEYFADVWRAAFSVFPPIAEVSDMVSASTKAGTTIHSFELPHDLVDCFAAAGWCRPEMYLDPSIRSCMSAFAVADIDAVAQGIRVLTTDLESGLWDKRYRQLRSLERLDVGYRFVKSTVGADILNV
ncbi:MAG: class I SAM-dependent methyltransferase [Candidatus Binatia bacterium]